MKTILNPIAAKAYQNALRAARIAPKQRERVDSRIADKFVVRGYKELFEELGAIGRYQGRSVNSEVVAAILEALDGFERTNAMARVLISHLGQDIALGVLKDVRRFDLNACIEPLRYTVRLPPQVRDTIRDGVRVVEENSGGQTTMNGWVLATLASWVEIQHQQYALVSAAIALEPPRLG